MPLIKALKDTVMDAIFPVSKAEQEVLSMNAEKAFKCLPRAKDFPIREACSIFAYKDDRVWRLIWCVKYKKSKQAAKIAAYALFQVLSLYARVADPIIIVPMPITKQRCRERGFNQCELIADEIEKLDSAKRFTIVRDLLVRARHRTRQTLKDRAERLEDAQNIFTVNDKATIKLDLLARQPGIDSNHLIIIIDDVVTTGSTIKDAVMTLRAAGLEKTFGLSVAH